MFPDRYFAARYFANRYFPIGAAVVAPAVTGGYDVYHPLPDWYSLAPYKYALAEKKRRREDEEIMVLIDG